MAAVKELIRSEADGSVSFGDYTLSQKTKLEDYQHEGDILKVKTFNEITRLEKNGLFLYESTPGTAVSSFKETENGISFKVEGPSDAQITVGLEEDTEYRIMVDGVNSGKMKTNLGGKLSFSVELAGAGEVKVEIKK
ncbi:MAG: endosialidase [Lachnospiraceae bacterium]|nr:endosialidase [Lachnospiraceae bacterium]